LKEEIAKILPLVIPAEPVPGPDPGAGIHKNCFKDRLDSPIKSGNDETVNFAIASEVK